jgi:hypothetical protein
MMITIRIYGKDYNIKEKDMTPYLKIVAAGNHWKGVRLSADAAHTLACDDAIARRAESDAERLEEVKP